MSGKVSGGEFYDLITLVQYYNFSPLKVHFFYGIKISSPMDCAAKKQSQPKNKLNSHGNIDCGESGHVIIERELQESIGPAKGFFTKDPPHPRPIGA